MRIFTTLLFGLCAVMALPVSANANQNDDAGEGGDDFVYKNVTTERAGTLATVLGDDTNLIDSLIVEGPINDADITTLWRASLYGKLKVINLEKAAVADGIIPDHAFSTIMSREEIYTPSSWRGLSCPRE